MLLFAPWKVAAEASKKKKSSTWEWHQNDCFLKISKDLRGVERGLKSVGADDDGHIFVFKHNLKYMYMCVCGIHFDNPYESMPSFCWLGFLIAVYVAVRSASMMCVDSSALK